ncbi:MAG: tripartite tricarboxylate transporter permease [Candidatus Hodarchaeota archaeon]
MLEVSLTEIISALFRIDIMLLVILGVVIGLTVSAIPGLTGTMAIAILLPFTYALTPIQGIALLIGTYKSSFFGGSISAIIFGTPGVPAATLDVLDGYPMSKRGEAKKAILIALYSSVLADFGSDLLLLFSIAPLAALSLAFGPSELLALMILAFVMVVMFVQESPMRGIVSLIIGILIALIGSSEHYVFPRFTFGITLLTDGIDMIAFLVGFFAFSEILVQIIENFRKKRLIETLSPFQTGGKGIKFIKFLKLFYKQVIIGWGMGSFAGALPGLGATIGAYLSYSVSKRLSRKGGEYGKGEPEGLSAAEAGNSATVGATFIPLFAFGIPGSMIAALFGAAFMMQGYTVGPGLLREQPTFIYTVLLLVIGANFFNLLVCKLLVPVYSYIAYLPGMVLYPFLGMFSVIGVYAYKNSLFDVTVMVLAGVFSCWMRAFNYPLLPVIIGFILAPLFESNLTRSLILSRGQIGFFLQSPIFIVLIALSVLVAILMIFWKSPEIK